MSLKDETDALWRVLPHPAGSVVRLFCRGGDSREGDFARSPVEVRRFIRAYEDRNVYVAPNPTQSTAGSRHAARDVTHWSYFLIDVDPVCGCPPTRKPDEPKCATCRREQSPSAFVNDVLGLLSGWTKIDFTLTSQRPIVIDSGRGMQVWIRLEDVLLNDVFRSQARRVNGYWLRRLDEAMGYRYGCRIDTSVSDLPRVMRCPGSVNQKTRREARFVVATDHVFVGLARVLLLGTPDQVLRDPDPPENVAAGQPWQRVFVHLTRSAQDYLIYGKAEPGRHKVMWHTARKFQELGVARPEARRALTHANALAGEEEELPPDQIEHALDTAYGA